MSEYDAFFSLKPKFASAVAAGRKTVELRRRAPRLVEGTQVWVYATVPKARVVAVSELSGIQVGPPNEIWRLLSCRVEIDRDAYDAYFHGVDQAVALLLEEVRPLPSGPTLYDLRRACPSFQAPQFFRRVWRGSAEHDLLLERSALAA